MFESVTKEEEDEIKYYLKQNTSLSKVSLVSQKARSTASDFPKSYSYLESGTYPTQPAQLTTKPFPKERLHAIFTYHHLLLLKILNQYSSSIQIGLRIGRGNDTHVRNYRQTSHP